MFSELDELHKSNPKAYMDLVRSLRDGSYDKKFLTPLTVTVLQKLLSLINYSVTDPV